MKALFLLCGLCASAFFFSCCLSDQAGKVTPRSSAAPAPATPVPTQVSAPKLPAFRATPMEMRTLYGPDDHPFFPTISDGAKPQFGSTLPRVITRLEDAP